MSSWIRAGPLHVFPCGISDILSLSRKAKREHYGSLTPLFLLVAVLYFFVTQWPVTCPRHVMGALHWSAHYRLIVPVRTLQSQKMLFTSSIFCWSASNERSALIMRPNGNQRPTYIHYITPFVAYEIIYIGGGCKKVLLWAFWSSLLFALSLIQPCIIRWYSCYKIHISIFKKKHICLSFNVKM